jgi:hypothetical protein
MPTAPRRKHIKVKPARRNLPSPRSARAPRQGSRKVPMSNRRALITRDQLPTMRLRRLILTMVPTMTMELDGWSPRHGGGGSRLGSLAGLISSRSRRWWCSTTITIVSIIIIFMMAGFMTVPSTTETRSSMPTKTANAFLEARPAQLSPHGHPMRRASTGRPRSLSEIPRQWGPAVEQPRRSHLLG